MDNFIKEINDDINTESVIDFIKQQGLDSYKSVREIGFRHTFEKRFENPISYDNPETMFDFTYFIATILNYDIMMFINNLAEARSKDENVEAICAAFSIMLDQLVDELNSITDIASNSVTIKNPQSKEEWEDYIHAQRDYISKTVDIGHITGNILSILVGNDIDFIDNMDEILEDLQQFYIAMEKIEELGQNKIGE